jgi:cytochrome c oxidase subunit 3
MSDTAEAQTNGHGADDPKPLMAHGSVLRLGIPNGKVGMWLFLGSEVMFFTGLIGAYIVLRLGGREAWADPTAADYPLSTALTAGNTFLLICSSVTLVYGLQHIQAGNQRKGNQGLLLTTIIGALFVAVQAYEYYEMWHQSDPVTELHAYADSPAGAADKVRLDTLVKPLDLHMKTAWSKMAGPKGLPESFSPKGERWSGMDKGKMNPTNLQLLETFIAQQESAEDKMALGHFVEHAKSHWHNPTRPHTSLFTSCFYTMTCFHGLHVLLGVIAMGAITVMGYKGKFSTTNYGPVENLGLYWHFVDLVWIILFAIVYLM